MSLDRGAVTAAFAELPSGADGLIAGFGGYLARLPCAYHEAIVRAFLDGARAEGGPTLVRARETLVSAAREASLATFVGAMRSSRWRHSVGAAAGAEERMTALLAVVEALGWGRWELASFTADELRVTIADGYEARSYLAAYGPSLGGPVCLHARGAATAAMSLVDEHHSSGRASGVPTDGSPGPGAFTSREVSCRATGASRCEIVVSRR